MMYIHVRYGAQKETFIFLFDHNFVTVADALGKTKEKYMKKTRLKLLNEHGIQMMYSAIVEKGRTYQMNRR